MLSKGDVIFSHQREDWQRMICGKTRPKYEWAQIIRHVAVTHEYKSREKRAMGNTRKEKYKEIQQEPKKIDKSMAFEMKLKRIYQKNK